MPSSARDNLTTAAAATPLPAPVLLAPANGATGAATQPTYTLSLHDALPIYRIIVSSNAADLTTDPTQSGGTPSNGFNVAIGQDQTSYSSTITLTAGKIGSAHVYTPVTQ